MNFNIVRTKLGRKLVYRGNPLQDPLGHLKQPLNRVRHGKAIVEFEPMDVHMIRAKFSATQKQFACLIGISVETLRNWEEGRRRPHGPARALLRAIDADPVALAKALNWHHNEMLDEPLEWTEE